MQNFKAFTLKDKGNLRVLKTTCGVCKAYDPLVEVNPPKVYEFVGLWDTGATGTVISQLVVERLGLRPIGKSKVYHANGESIVNTYIINLFLPNQVAFPFVKVTEGILNGTDLLIGMDIITMGDFSISNVGGNTCFSFRIPSIQEVDFVEDWKTPYLNKPLNQSKLGRNEPCSCGSGKKYKNCHGKE